MNSDNPFASPTAESVTSTKKDEANETFGMIAKRTFLAWEKLRIVFVAILGLMTLLLGFGELTNVKFWTVVIPGAIAANICFFAGPIVETYVTWLGFESIVLRVAMFTFGTLLSLILAAGALAGLMLPDMP